MNNHSTHCKDPGCYGCECTPDCDYWDDEPNVLAERERIIALLETRFKESLIVGSIVAQGEDVTPVISLETAIALIKGEQ